MPQDFISEEVAETRRGRRGPLTTRVPVVLPPHGLRLENAGHLEFQVVNVTWGSESGSQKKSKESEAPHLK